MTRSFDWKWVGIGALIMLALSFVGGLLVSLVWGEELAAAAEGPTTDIALTGGQLAIFALISFLGFAIGGYIVGVRSAGRTILEPAVAAAVAVAIGLLIAGQFSFGNLLAGAVVPFLAGLLGGWLGERRQSATTLTTTP
jgi:MFS family permease